MSSPSASAAAKAKSASAEYEVENIIDYRTNPINGLNEYLIKWKGYSSSENTWEPESNLNEMAMVEARALQRKIDTDGNRNSYNNRAIRHNIIDQCQYYDNLAPNIDLHEITTRHQNRRILKRLIRNDRHLTQLYIVEEDDEENRRYDGLNSGNNFIPSVLTLGSTTTNSGTSTKADDMGWLGYFIGKSRTLQYLHIGSLHKGEEHIEPFWTGIQHNRSISSLRFDGCSILHGSILSKLSNFFKYNPNLIKIELSECTLGDEGAYQFSRALGECTNQSSLRIVRLDDNELRLRGLKCIIRALGLHSNIEALTLSDNNLGREGCKALGRYLSSMRGKLKDLNVSYNRIDDEALSYLVEGLCSSSSSTPTKVIVEIHKINNDDNGSSSNNNNKKKKKKKNDLGYNDNCSLKQLCLTGNSSISSTGLREVTSLMSTPHCNLEQLWLYHINIGDEGASILADGLSKNKSLRKLWFNPTTCGITSVGWDRFNTLLCDTSSINNTYLSNHTLELIGKHYSNYAQSDDQIPRGIRRHFRLHYSFLPPQQIAKYKIIRYHEDMKMDQFLDLNLKFLPLVVGWFRKVRATLDDRPYIRSRELSSIFQFVRGLPFFFGSDSGLAVRAVRDESRNNKRKSPPDDSSSQQLPQQSQGNVERKKRRVGQAFAIGDSVMVQISDFFTDVAVVKNVTHEGLKAVYQVQFGDGEIWGGIGADALSVTSLGE